MDVRIERGDEVIRIALDDTKWALFLRHYGDDFLRRLCEGLLDPALSLGDIARGLKVSAASVRVWGQKIEPYIPATHRVMRKQGSLKRYGTVIVEIVQGGDTISIPVNRKSHQHFENKYGAYGGMQRFFSLLAEECNSFQDIAGRYQMTGGRVSQYYDQYLAPALGAKNGRERQRVCTIARLHIERFPDYMLAVWRRARRHGLAVSPVNFVSQKTSDVWTLRKTLWLNDSLCRVHVVSSDTVTARRTGLVEVFIRTSGMRQEKYAFHICVIRFFERHHSEWVYYVIPSGAIPQAESSRLYLPVSAPAERMLKREAPWLVKYDWPQYRDAWHLIP